MESEPHLLHPTSTATPQSTRPTQVGLPLLERCAKKTMKIPTMNTQPIAFLIVVLNVFHLSSVSAATPIVSITQSAWDYSGSGLVEDGMVGWTFYVSNSVTVTQIGWFDEGGDGLSRAIQVGLWQATSEGFSADGSVVELLGTAGSGLFIPGGTAAQLNGYFRVVDLAVPIELQPGSYQIAGLITASTADPTTFMWDGGHGIFNTPDVSVGPFFYGIMTESEIPSGFTWVDSSNFYLASGLEMGPMLFAVPEASTPILLMFGLAMVLSRRRVDRH